MYRAKAPCPAAHNFMARACSGGRNNLDFPAKAPPRLTSDNAQLSEARNAATASALFASRTVPAGLPGRRKAQVEMVGLV